MSRAATVLAIVVALCLLGPTTASADGDGIVTPGDDDFNAVIEVTSPEVVAAPSAPGSAESSTTAEEQFASDPCRGADICSAMLICEAAPESPLGGVFVWRDPGVPPMYFGWCVIEDAQPIVITASMALSALRRVPLPESELVVQPPGGRTLVNFATNFYTEAEPFERSVRILGQRVDLRIWPSSFAWDFGDGAQVTTVEAGAPYPDLEVTHEYRRRGRVGASVDTTYSADFRVNGGPWRPVSGTVTMPGEPVGLRVLTATPTLVGYDR